MFESTSIVIIEFYEGTHRIIDIPLEFMPTIGSILINKGERKFYRVNSIIYNGSSSGTDVNVISIDSIPKIVTRLLEDDGTKTMIDDALKLVPELLTIIYTSKNAYENYLVDAVERGKNVIYVDVIRLGNATELTLSLDKLGGDIIKLKSLILQYGNFKNVYEHLKAGSK